jgi:hypothetical protein
MLQAWFAKSHILNWIFSPETFLFNKEDFFLILC